LWGRPPIPRKAPVHLGGVGWDAPTAVTHLCDTRLTITAAGQDMRSDVEFILPKLAEVTAALEALAREKVRVGR
jgi:hypothetical protein